MRVFLSGQKHFGYAVLRLLADRPDVEIIGVSAPAPNGREDRLWREAQRLGLATIPAGRLNADVLPGNTDLIVCAHSHDYISQAMLNKTKLGGIGYHPSLLPLHRGRDAIYWTVKMGDKVTGGTVYWLSESVDGGPVAAQEWCFVPPGVKPIDLWVDTLQPMGLRLVSQTLDGLALGVITAVPQDETLATWEPSVGREPLFRPDLLRLGCGPDGYRVVTNHTGQKP